MDEEKDAPRGFRVTDRRRFTEEGGERDDAPPASQPEPSAADSTPHLVQPSSATLDEPADAPHDFADEPLTFSTFVLGLSTQVLMHLGEVPNPISGQAETDLEAAKHVIDILGILAEKTRNNLDKAEQHLLEAVLYDLRIRYVALVRGASKEGS